MDCTMRKGGEEETRCPKCGLDVNEGDIEDIHLRGAVVRHYVYVSRNCGHIIGFSSNVG